MPSNFDALPLADRYAILKAEAEALAAQIAGFPPVAMTSDRQSAYESFDHDQAAAIHREMELSLGDLRVCDLLSQAADKVRARVEGRGASLTVSCPADLKPIRADEHRIGQALDHLLENAARAVSEGGAVELKAETGPSEIRLTVSDTGRGIPQKDLARVFEEFYQVQSARPLQPHHRKGLGLGLAIVKHIINRHQGGLVVESAPGMGAAFTAWFPQPVERR